MRLLPKNVSQVFASSRGKVRFESLTSLEILSCMDFSALSPCTLLVRPFPPQTVLDAILYFPHVILSSQPASVSFLNFHLVPGGLPHCFRAALLHLLLLIFYLIPFESNTTGVYFPMTFLVFASPDDFFLSKASRVSRFPAELQLFLTPTSTSCLPSSLSS